MRIASENLEQLWYENEAGDRFIPPLDGDMPPDIPEGFHAQHAMFVTYLKEEVNVTITAEQVAACDHPVDMMIKDMDIVDGHESRKCRKCAGYQERETEQPWGEDWSSGHSQLACAGNSSWDAKLVLAMTRPTEAEAKLQMERFDGCMVVGVPGSYAGSKLPPRFGLEEAVIISARSCERCMNALFWTYGVSFSGTDDGYPELSDEWKRCGTSCKFCEHMGQHAMPETNPGRMAQPVEA